MNPISRRSFLLSASALVLLPVPLPAGTNSVLPTFTDVTEKAGIKFKHSIGDVELRNIVQATGPGGCVFDYNNDGFMDIYASSTSIMGISSEVSPTCRLRSRAW
jgi:hypothetical protein